MARTFSHYYGSPRLGANKYPGYSTDELRRDLASPSIDADTARQIAAEIERRETKRRQPTQ